MKNKEKFSKEIVEFAIKSQPICVNQNGRIMRCSPSQCKNCIFYKGAGRCCDKRKEWAESEYVDPKVFTEDEKAFIRACDNIKYLTRDVFGNLYAFAGEEKPKKYFNDWGLDDHYGGVFLFGITSLSFSAIKWEDAEPTSREEIENGK